MAFDPTVSLLAGMDEATLRARLIQLQTDYLDLSTGRKLQSATYAQGDGSKGVVYTKAELGQLAEAIRLVQAQLGYNVRRGARRVYF